MKQIYLTQIELKQIRDAVRSASTQGSQNSLQIRGLRQLSYKLDCLDAPAYGAVLVSDPSQVDDLPEAV